AVSVLPDGRVLLSTTGSVTVSGVSAANADLLAFTPTSLGSTTAGTWALYFDGSDVGLTASGENIDALYVQPSTTPGANPTLYFSTSGTFAVSGLSGNSNDVFQFNPTSLGPTTQ